MHVYVHLLLYALWEALSGVRVHNRNADRLTVPVSQISFRCFSVVLSSVAASAFVGSFPATGGGI